MQRDSLFSWLAVALLVGFAGCSGDADGPGHDGEDDGTAAPEAPTESVGPAAVLSLTNFTANLTSGPAPLTVLFTFNGTGSDAVWSLDADGDGVGDHNGTGLPAQATHTYDASGRFNATLRAEAGNSTVNRTLLIVVQDLVDEAAPAPPEGGHIESSTQGAFAQAVIGRTGFEIQGDHPVLEVTTFLEDPAATLGGQEYTVRFTPPSGGNNDYTVGYGDTITIEDPEVGGWEIGIFPAGAGAFDWTADWCAFSDQAC